MSWKQHGVACAAFTAVTAVLGGCSSDSDPQPQASNYLADAYDAAMASGGTDLPLRQTFPWLADDSSAEAKSRHDTRQVLIKECMANQGVTSYVPSDMPPPAPKFDVDSDRAVVEQRGYGYDPEQVAQEENWDHMHKAFEKLPQPEQTTFIAVLHGDDGASGCRLEAERTLYGADYDGEYLINNETRIHNSLWDTVRDSEQFTKHHQQWVECMAGKDFQVTAVHDAANDMAAAAQQQQLTGDDFTAFQIKHALADYDCRKESKVATVWNALTTAGEEHLKQENAEFFGTLKTQRDHAAKVINEQ